MKVSQILLLLGILSGAAQAQMHKCVDARGVTQYSDKPIPGCKSREVDIRGQEPISGKLDSYGGDLKSAERDFQQRQQQREREQAAQDKAAAEQRARCERMRAQLQRFTSMRRVPSPTAKPGERDYMDAPERDAKAAEMQAIIARNCG